VNPLAGPIDRDNGVADGSVGDDRVVCAEAELETNKPNIQVATAARISVSLPKKGETKRSHFFTSHPWRR
jgi:hypothetical protein